MRLVGQSLLFVGRAALLNPIGLVITAIAGAALAIYNIGSRSRLLRGFWQGLREGLAPIATTLEPAFTALASALSPLKPIWDGIVTVLGTAWDWVTNCWPRWSHQRKPGGRHQCRAPLRRGAGWIINFIPNAIADFIEFGLISSPVLQRGYPVPSVARDTIVGMGGNVIGWFKDTLASITLAGVRRLRGTSSRA
nr:hypothetical protein [Halolamina pelagica]